MNRKNYSLSIIVPVYNAEFTIQYCLESILNQTYKDFELILIDDGSVDRSSELCDEFVQSDKRITTFHIKNSGPYQARKFGAQMASGEILTFSDADDWLEKHAIETAMQIFQDYNPDILAYAYSYGENKIEKHLYDEGLYYKEEIRDIIIPGMMYDFLEGRRRLDPSLCCKLIKKKLFMEVTESVEDRITLGDDALVVYPAVCRAENIFICNRALYHYSFNDHSCTHTYPLERILEVKAFQENMIRLFKEIGILSQVEYQIENYVRSFFSMMVRSWYGIEVTPVLFSLPYNIIPKGAKVFVYGAGNVGKSYINELKLTHYAEIAGWADQKYESIREYNGVKVITPEKIREIEFDILLIAALNEEVSKEIQADLVNMEIMEEKIVWKKPISII